MSWVKLDDGFGENERIAALRDRAFRVHVVALCYCARNLTDGHVSMKALKVLSILLEFDAKRYLEDLVSSELWTADESGDGYWISGFLDYNPDSETVKEERRKARVRMQNLRKDRACSPERSGEHSGERSGERSGTPSRPVPKRENPEGFSQIVDSWLAQAPPLIRHRDNIRRDASCRRAVAKAIDTYGLNDVIQAVTNYAQVLSSEAHYFEHRWTLPDFLTRGLRKFVPEAEPLTNFKSKQFTVAGRDRGVDIAGIHRILSEGGSNGARTVPLPGIAQGGISESDAA